MTLGGILGNRLIKKGLLPWWTAGGVIPRANVIRMYKAIGAASLAASYINLPTPGVGDAAPGVAPTFAAASGWTGDGTQWLTPGAIAPAIDGNWSLVIRYSGLTLGTAFVTACGSGSNILGFRMQAGQRDYYYGGVDTKFSAGAAAGVVIIAGGKVYLNGVDEGLALDQAVPGSQPPYIFCRNNSGPAGISICSIQAWGLINIILTPTQVTALNTAVAALV